MTTPSGNEVRGGRKPVKGWVNVYDFTSRCFIGTLFATKEQADVGSFTDRCALVYVHECEPPAPQRGEDTALQARIKELESRETEWQRGLEELMEHECIVKEQYAKQCADLALSELQLTALQAENKRLETVLLGAAGSVALMAQNPKPDEMLDLARDIRAALAKEQGDG